MKSTQPLILRALRHVQKTDGCWLWIGPTQQDGYGRLTPGHGQQVGAHRWFYAELRGPIPPGMELDHLCRVRNCVNPEHLEPVTHAENMRRARLTHCRRGHEFTPENTYIRPNKYLTRVCRQCKTDWTKARDAA